MTACIPDWVVFLLGLAALTVVGRGALDIINQIRKGADR